MQSTSQGKRIAVISYLSFVGTFIAMSMNSDEKSEFASFHIRQSAGLFVVFFSMAYFIGYFNSNMISASFFLAFSILWFFGFTGALNNEKRVVPLVGSYFQKWFSNL